MAVLCVVAPCSLVDYMDLKMEAASTSDTSVNVCQNTRPNNPVDSHLCKYRKNTFQAGRVRISLKVSMYEVKI
jgi:hypothetical protein